MSVAVTGAAGFIGRWVVAELLDRGHAVSGLDDLSTGRRANVAAFSDAPGFELVDGDVRDTEAVDRVIDDDTEVCLHLAARIDVQESLEEPTPYYETNVTGTHRVLEACRRADTRLVLVGTCMVYDVAAAGGGIDETHPTAPASPYAGTKLAAEDLALSYWRGYDLPVTVLRPFNTYGPFQRTGASGGVVPIFVSRDLAGEPLRIYGDGTQTRDLMYVTDCARFVVDAAFSDATVGEVVNAGTGREVSVNELAELIATGDTPIEHVEHHHPQSEVERLRCDPRKAEELLNWRPEVGLEAGIDRQREWLKGQEAP